MPVGAYGYPEAFHRGSACKHWRGKPGHYRAGIRQRRRANMLAKAARRRNRS